MQSYSEAQERVLNDMRLLVADAKKLLKAAKAGSSEKVASLRPRVEATLSQARTRLREMEHAAEERARRAALEANAYVHENPWKVAGVAAGIGAIAGILLARR